LQKINLVVIGHKDHGKSTLIGRLLYDSKAITEKKLEEVEAELKKAGDEGFRFAFLLDTLEEERRGGLTIDIMQTPFKTEKHLYTIIDCPGHREFIKKMFTGASHADAAVIVVSAKEGVQDQTKQHAFLIKTLGIEQLIVAVNKMDLVNYKKAKFKEICEKLLSILDSIGYKKSPIVPLSALNGENVYRKSEIMRWYRGSSLIETLDQNLSPPTPPIYKHLRACVQDVYELENEKIIVCKILTGTLKEGKMVVVNPSGQKGLIKKIVIFGKETQRADPGDSVGVIIDEVTKIERGEIITYLQNMVRAPQSFIAQIIVFSDMKVRNDDILMIRCGTAEKKCRVQKILEKIDPINLIVETMFPEDLKAGDVGKLVLSPIEPICIEEYSNCPELGRYIVEGKKGASAAGIIMSIQL